MDARDQEVPRQIDLAFFRFDLMSRPLRFFPLAADESDGIVRGAGASQGERLACTGANSHKL